MSDLSQEDRDLLELARAAPGPTAEDRVRVRRAIAVGAPLAALGTLSASSKAAGASLGVVKGALLFVLAGGVGSGVVIGIAAIRRPPPVPHAAPAERPPTAPRHAAPIVPTEPEPGPSAAPDPAPAPTPVAAPIARPARTTHAARVEEPGPTIAPAPAPAAAAPLPRCTLEHEASVLQAAQRELDSAPAQSLRALDALESECPGGELAEERHAARALALCALGRKDAGRVDLEWLRRNGAASPALPRVRKACEEP